MHKKLATKLCIILSIVTCFAAIFTGCGVFGNDKEYTIQYTDNAGTHQLTVTYGMPYSIESIPYKYGYEFLGLYDAETGGTQYINAGGSSVSVYSIKKNLILYPQFKAIDYTVILDYQGAEVTGERSLTVPYNSNLPELPKNLVHEHSEFTGWYTEKNSKGTQIADRYGLLPVVSVLNENNFELDDTNHRAYLYAGFELETYTVTFNFGEGMAAEEVNVPYNTPISEVVPKTRNDNGEAVLLWSTKADDDTAIFNGRVTGKMVLYAVEWAPVIEFNVNGGNEVTPVVARAGSAISLPTPTKSLAKFLYWETADGYEVDLTTMPSKSTTLKAVWQAKIEFDSNGGTEVDNISESAGTSITLPMPEKDGYLFAGWYTADKEKYERSTMPSEGIALKAGWYKEKSDNVVRISSSSSKSSKVNKASVSSACYTLQYSNYFSNHEEVNIRLKGHVKIESSYAKFGANSVYLEIYSQKTISSSYLIAKETFQGVTVAYRSYEFEINLTISDDVYMCWYHECPYNTWDFELSDFYYTVYYPDTTYLYL